MASQNPSWNWPFLVNKENSLQTWNTCLAPILEAAVLGAFIKTMDVTLVHDLTLVQDVDGTILLQDNSPQSFDHDTRTVIDFDFDDGLDAYDTLNHNDAAVSSITSGPNGGNSNDAEIQARCEYWSRHLRSNLPTLDELPTYEMMEAWERDYGIDTGLEYYDYPELMDTAYDSESEEDELDSIMDMF